MDKDQGLVLPSESTSVSETHILDVNFDCLHEIFSLQCLSMLDLCSIGESHDRFKEVVDDVFAKRHKKYSVDLRKIIDPTTRILNNFGPFISQLTIDGRWHMDKDESIVKWNQLLELMTKYCGSGTLDSLDLLSVTISEAQTIKLKPIFGKLQKISLFDCKIYSGKALFSDCASLVELKLNCVKFEDQYLVFEDTFPKLDRFEFRSNTRSNTKLSPDFFSRHPNLKSLTLSSHHEISHLLPRIADNCKQMTELDIRIEKHEDEVTLEKALTSILSLDHLNKLGIHGGGRDITTFIKKLEDSKLLEILSLWMVDYDSEFVPSLSKLTKLKVLELGWCPGLTNLNPLADLERLTELKIYSGGYLDFDLVCVIKGLINLKTLELRWWSFEMDQQMYLRIVDAVRKRPAQFKML